MTDIAKIQQKQALQKNEQTAVDSRDMQVVCFKLGTESYGLDIMQIKEIIRYQKVQLVPKAPLFVDGVINLRGVVIPIIDLRKRFEMPSDISSRTRIIIAQLENRIVGIVVDEIIDIISLSKAHLMSPGMVRGREAEYLDGMADIKGELLFVINLNKMLTAEEKMSLATPV
jgi:purine-binding chemotaxis protein CheW